MKLYITRHCQSLSNAAGIIDDNASPGGDLDRLSAVGWAQAEALAKELETRTFDIIIVSPFKRAMETVEPYLKCHNTRVIVSTLIGERNAGVFAAMPKDAMKKYCHENDIHDRVSWRPENGESILDVYERAKLFLDYLKCDFTDKNVLVCGHTNFLRCLDIAIRETDIMQFYDGEELQHGEIKEYDL